MKYKYVSISAIIISIVLGCALHAEEERTLRVVPRTETAIPGTTSDEDAGLKTAPISATIIPGKKSVSAVPKTATAIPGGPDVVLQTPLRITDGHRTNRDRRSWQLFLEQGKEWDGFKGIDPRLHEILRILSGAEEQFLSIDLAHHDIETDCYSGGAYAAGSERLSIRDQQAARCIASDSIQACIDKWINMCTSHIYQERTEAKVRLLDVLGELQQFLQAQDYSRRY